MPPTFFHASSASNKSVRNKKWGKVDEKRWCGGIDIGCLCVCVCVSVKEFWTWFKFLWQVWEYAVWKVQLIFERGGISLCVFVLSVCVCVCVSICVCLSGSQGICLWCVTAYLTYSVFRGFPPGTKFFENLVGFLVKHIRKFSQILKLSTRVLCRDKDFQPKMK